MSEVLWQPTQNQINQSRLSEFQELIEKKINKKFKNYQELHQFSVDEKELFWISLIEYFQVPYSGTLSPALKNNDESFSEYGWFPNLELNFCEALLSSGLRNKKKSNALHFVHESGFEKSLTFKELSLEVAKLQGSLKSIIKKGLKPQKSIL